MCGPLLGLRIHTRTARATTPMFETLLCSFGYMFFFWEVMDVGAENICPVDTAIWLSVPCQSARAIQIYVRVCHQMVGNICK